MCSRPCTSGCTISLAIIISHADEGDLGSHAFALEREGERENETEDRKILSISLTLNNTEISRRCRLKKRYSLCVSLSLLPVKLF